MPEFMAGLKISLPSVDMPVMGCRVRLLCGLVVFAAACSDAGSASGTGGAGADGNGSGAGLSSGGANANGGGYPAGGSTSTYSSGNGAPPTSIAECQGHVYECGDLVDNDSDGLLDSQDPDCLGPCDNTEDSYYGGIPGQAGPACLVDCYWDQDSGSGNDDCHWNHQCDPLSVAPDYHPESIEGATCAYDADAKTAGAQDSSCAELSAAQSDSCLNFCRPLTPNGCDCFGCCELPAGSGKHVWLGSDSAGTKDGSCTMDGVSDPSKCEPCTPVPGCLNDCDECEVCLGKPTVPDSCFTGGTGGGTSTGGGSGEGGSTGSGPLGGGASDPPVNPGQCASDLQSCGLLGQAPCPEGEYCTTGCCVAVPK